MPELKIEPITPRLINKDAAAAYLGIGKTNFRGRWRRSELPRPIKIGERQPWDVRLLDAWIDALVGMAPVANGWDDRLPPNPPRTGRGGVLNP